MPKSTGHSKTSTRKNKVLTKSRVTTPKLARPLKTPLTRKGMSPRRFLEAAGSISVKTLDAMEKAIEEGCGRVESHGE